MKVLTVTVSFLIIASTLGSKTEPSFEIPEAVNQQVTCCLKYHEKVLPRRLVRGYRKALSCHLPAIIFITKRNREVCANPNDDWVQEYIKNPNLPLLPSRHLAWVKITIPGKGQP
ncbi:C-C motif chemokine 14 isoform X1 [Elephas maximus indicus]|uniref:C-C motif chemokine 14 isoform X1 n=1 Tax=Elephas maximus indicus TaxID=99487 RepID=UPI002115EA7D|nr:C-C motif chemokine 14 isoform X1 [Elephas maximus indicus]